jgi:cyclic beta-1,2-glucan synthetase
MAHPLNQPQFDIEAGRVVAGYAVLQPRVTPSLPVGREGSLFQRVFSSMNGIDPYATTASDVYQDLFGEGSYAGKGIYDVDAFEAALNDRVPESTLLSHDLFEGTFARAGLASDAEVVEEYPSRYDVVVARQHRWARGDWQLLPWIFGRGDASRGPRSRSTLPLIGRWKMLDNLRRTLSAPASVLALLIAWTLPKHDAALWTFFILATIAVPTLLPVFAAILPRHARTTARSHLDALADDLGLALTQTALTATFLAHQSWSMADAIGRTLFRLFVSHRNLLEWVTAANTSLAPQLQLAGAYLRMAGSILVGAASVFVLWLGGGRRVASRNSVRSALARRPRHRAMGEPFSSRGRPPSDVRTGRARPAIGRPLHLALFRGVRHGSGSYAAARQFSGRPQAGPRAPHLSDEYGSLSSLRDQRPRPGLDRDRGSRRTAGGIARHDGQARTVSRPLLQLV